MGYNLKSAFRPSERKKGDDKEIEINVTPIMNLVVVLIPLLLQAITVITLGRIDYKPPPAPAAASEGEGSGEGSAEEPLPNLDLVLNVNDSVFEVSIFGSTKEGENFWKIPKTTDGIYDFAGLQNTLLDIKENTVGEPTKFTAILDSAGKATVDAEGNQLQKATFKYEDATLIRVACLPSIPYQVIVSIIDATGRVSVDGVDKVLFPQPILGQIATVMVDG